MDLYSGYDKSFPQKIAIVAAQAVLIVVAYFILFPSGINFSKIKSSWKEISFLAFLIFNLVNFIRFLFTLFVFIKRKIPLEEVFSVPLAFALYYIGYPLIAGFSDGFSGITFYGAVIFFLSGIFINSFSEYQRFLWKKNPQNKGKIFTSGLFSVSRHPNYFGDILWVSGYAILTSNYYSVLIPLFLFSFFYFYNIPLQEKHMTEKYRENYVNYQKKVKAIIPFVL